MALLLHMSDLHLGDPTGPQILGDYKEDIIPPKARQTRKRLLEDTLSGLQRHLDETHRTLDGVVITGDITIANNNTGYEMLDSLLDSLGSALPVSSKIVIEKGDGGS